MSVLKDTQFTLTSPTFVGADGETPTDCASTPTCTVTRSDGTELTDAAVTAAAGDGLYDAAITTTHTSQLDRLTIVWTGTAGSLVQVYTGTLEVAGGWYVTIPEAKNEPDLTTASVAEIRRARDEFESLAEHYCDCAFVPRFHLETLRGDGSANVLLRYGHLRDLLSLSVGGTAQTLSDYTLDSVRGLTKTSGTITSPADNAPNVVVGYTHGYDRPPAELKEACLRYIRARITTRSAGIPNNLVDGAEVRGTFSLPREGHPTGIESVDEVLNRLSQRIPGVA